MNWYKRHNRKQSAKSDRDKGKKQLVTLWHASPDRLSALQPRSRFGGLSGLYLSQSYRSLIEDWIPFIKNKKHKNHPFTKQWSEICDEIFKYEDIPNKTPEQETKLIELRDKRDQLRYTLDSDSFQDSTRKGYQNIFIYKISCPKEAYDASMKRMDDIYDATNGAGGFGFWAWGQQVFIPDYLLNQCQIVSVKELRDKDFEQKYRDMSSDRYKQRKL